MFALYGKTGNLRTHVNHDPGDHNFELENREAYYKIVGDHFFAGQPFDSKEIPSAEEVKTPEQLNVELPKTNEDFHSLAMKLAEKLPHAAAIPTAADQLTKWSEAKRNQLREITRFKKETIQSIPESASRTLDHATVTHWWLRHAGAWTIPAVEFTPEKVTGSVLIVTDEGRKSIPAGMIEDQLKQGNRVVAMDPFYLGESKISERDFLHALQLACVGDRPLGLQASQIASVAAWIRKQSEGLSKTVPVRVISMGPRTSLATLVASALEPDSISEIELHKSLRSLKQVIEKNMGVNEIPEYFCFGLLEFFDIPQLTALTTPRRSTFVGATE
ncbi:MAG: hypothetical protein FJ267_12835 [Planctomycetes bacterium]|nr:hypothetical protein [Planctomycetota bacterium]